MNVAKNVCALTKRFVRQNNYHYNTRLFFFDKILSNSRKTNRTLVKWSRLPLEQKLIMKITCAFQLYYGREPREIKLFQYTTWQFLEDTKIIELANFHEAKSLQPRANLRFNTGTIGEYSMKVSIGDIKVEETENLYTVHKLNEES